MNDVASGTLWATNHVTNSSTAYQPRDHPKVFVLQWLCLVDRATGMPHGPRKEHEHTDHEALTVVALKE